MSIIQGTAHSGAGYNIERSLRFNSADSAYLNRTLGSNSTSNTTGTFSCWVKRGTVPSAASRQHLFVISNSGGTGNLFAPGFSTDTVANVISVLFDAAGTYWPYTPAVFRDPSAWYHIVIAINTTQATASNRCRIYVNGVEQTSLSGTQPPQNHSMNFGSGNIMQLGSAFTSRFLDGYMTEVYWIDGQQLTPSSFGQTNSSTGVWEPVKYTGTYGTNGFYLNFADNSGTTSTTLGKDSSGNGNNWTPNNFSVTAGAGNDSLVDTPTPYGTDTGAGGEVRGNYATLNPLNALNPATLTDGNLVASSSSAAWRTALSTIQLPTSGKWYFECTIGSAGVGNGVEIGLVSYDQATYRTYKSTGTKNSNGGGAVAYGASYTGSDVIGTAIDVDAGTIVFYKNNSSQGTAFSDIVSAIPSSGWYLAIQANNSSNHVANFGQRPFAYTAPSGFKALCTTNLPTPTIGATSTTQANDYFNVVLYTGNGSTQSITGVGFQPDFVWIKQRDAATYDHNLFDAVRGANKAIFSNQTGAEITYTDRLTSFNSDGFSLGSGAGTNSNGSTRVAWNWKANGTGSTNTAGSITSTVSANTTAGFSIVNWTGSTSTSSQTVGHGLGVTPKMVIVKNRDLTDIWFVYHASATSTSQYLTLSGTSGTTNNANALWGAGMTSTLVGVRPASFCAATSDDVIMYVFAEVAGYSAFGSYTGNGSTDGPFIFTNFRPRYVLIKRTDTTGTWLIEDTGRNTYNLTDLSLSSESSAAELTQTTAGNPIDILSSGFKCRGTGASSNANTGTYIYAAFAESPFKYSLAR